LRNISVLVIRELMQLNFCPGKPQMDMIPTLSNTNSEKNTNSTVIYKLQLQSMET